MKSTAAATFVVAQIETFAASHIGDIYRRSLFVTKTVTFVSHQNVCVTATCHNITHVGHTMWGVQDPPSSSRRMLPKFEDFGKQRSVYASGVGGGGEGGHTWQGNIFMCLLKSLFHENFLCVSSNPSSISMLFDRPEVWLVCRGRGIGGGE